MCVCVCVCGLKYSCVCRWVIILPTKKSPGKQHDEELFISALCDTEPSRQADRNLPHTGDTHTNTTLHLSGFSPNMSQLPGQLLTASEQLQSQCACLRVTAVVWEFTGNSCSLFHRVQRRNDTAGLWAVTAGHTWILILQEEVTLTDVQVCDYSMLVRPLRSAAS